MDSSRNDPTPTQILAGTPAPFTLTLDADAKKHFDTFEAHFFQQGDQAGLPGTDDTYYERNSRIERWLPYRTLMGISIASTTLAVIACVALWQTHRPAPTPPAIIHAVPAPVTPTAVAAAVALPVPGAEPTAPAAPSPTMAPAALAPVVEAELPAVDKPAAATVVAAVPAAPGEARARCRESVHARKAKSIVAACSAAFEADATFAEAAVAVAKVEFDRGRYTQAHTWSKKALAADPASADAYVYAGGAEQNRGHIKAAREAYLQYLRLAPSGRYAAELRAIVKSL